MKTKRTAVVAFLLCAIMAIGIGFAAISRNLEINGNANLGINEPGFSVSFVEKTDGVAGCETNDGGVSKITIDSSDSSIATFTVNGLKAEGDEVTGTFVIKNSSESNYDAVLGTPSLRTPTKDQNAYIEFISITAEFASGAKTTIGKGETTTFTVTVKLLKVINEASAQVTFQVIIPATSALPTSAQQG